MRRAAKKRVEAAQKLLSSELPLPKILFFAFIKHVPTASQRKASSSSSLTATHETHSQYNKLPKLTPMDLSRMKAEKDARDGQDLALARQRQSEQVRLMREQNQRAAAIPVRNLLLLLFRLVQHL